MDLRWLTLDELKEREAQVAAILARSTGGYTLDWVYRRIHARELFAVAAIDGEQDVGIALLAIDRLQPRSTLFLLGIAGMGSRRWLREFRPILARLARGLGCEVIQGVAGPGRAGWRRYAKPVATIYEMEV